MDEAFKIELAMGLADIFQLPGWQASIEIEKLLLKKIESEIVSLRPAGDKDENFLTKNIYLRGKRDLFFQLWREREMILAQLKALEEKRDAKE